jgi:protein NRD1
MLTAEYGGTGGLPIESGMVVEEPDIEIGAGVSSKGMSQLPQPFSFFFFPFSTFAFLDVSRSQWCIVLTLILLLFTAISRRMATDQGGKRGPQSSRGGNHGSSRPNDRPRFSNDNDRPTSSDNTNTNTAAPPQIPGYNFNFANLPGSMQMPIFPPGFVMPGMPPQNGSGSGP